MADTQPEPIHKKTCGSCRQLATPLSCSLNYGNCDRIQKYFENDPLCICNPSSINSIEKFLQKSPNMLQKTFYSKEFYSNLSLLMYSVLKGYIDVVQMLVRAGANINRSFPKYKTPIFQAVYLEDKTIGRELISAGATIDPQNHEGHDLLEVALEKHHEYLIKGMIIHVADENAGFGQVIISF